MNIEQKIKHLSNNNKLPHAVVFEGADCSKALEIFLKAVLCSGDNKPCQVCKHCQKVATKTHPDVLEFYPEGANKGFKIDTIRSIRETAHVLPNEAEKKVIILHDADNISSVSQNALLKILEEPPAHAVFVMTVKQKSHLLDTIISRVSVLLCDEEVENENKTDAFELLENLCFGTQLDMLECTYEYLSSKDKAIMLVTEFIEVLRTVYRVKLGVQIDSEYEQFLEKLTLEKILKCIEIAEFSRASLVRNKNRKLTVNLFCVKLKSVL